jgi:hypothetical protein
MPALDLLNAQDWDAELVQLIQSAPMPGLDSGPNCSETSQKVGDYLLNRSLADSKMAAGLWLLAGELERSHLISQSITDRDGSFWHAIMHRREGDFSNAKYWLRHASPHPLEPKLLSKIAEEGVRDRILMPVNDSPLADSFLCMIVDLVKQAERKDVKWRDSVQQICWWEWQLLFEHCFNLSRN